MTITSDQIVLAESEVMADTDDGGGRMSGNIVESGQVNNTFPDISRVDRVYGRVQLRKLFMSVRAPNQDTLLGAHTILSEMPKDPNVHVLLFNTRDHIDRRNNAKNRIESYVVASSEAPYWLWGTQLAGQRAIMALGFPASNEHPEPGMVMMLTNTTTGIQEYVRVVGVDIKGQVFTIVQNSQPHTFHLWTYKIDLARPIENDYAGSDPHFTGNLQKHIKILKTQIADSARYYGISTLTAPAEPGDQTIHVKNVFAPLVPSAQSENALADVLAGAAAAVVHPAATATVTVSNITGVTVDPTGAGIYYAGRPIVPGTLQITGNNGNYTDDGGRLVHTGGPARLDVDNSVVDYNNGQIRAFYQSGGGANQSTTITFLPGAVLTAQSKQDLRPVNQQTRSMTWVYQTRPRAAPRTFTLDYRAQGNWYRLRDNGAGVLQGDGTGTINYATGTVAATLAALPDAGTSLLFAWGEEQGTRIETNPAVADNAVVRIEIGDLIGA